MFQRLDATDMANFAKFNDLMFFLTGTISPLQFFSQLTDESLYPQFLEVVLLSGNLTKCKVFKSAVRFSLRCVSCG